MATKKPNPRDDHFVADAGVSVTTPQCHSCAHWNKDLTCKAFPTGIPTGIFMNAIDHTKKVEGDGGVTYKKAS